jgi:hypothetical protein
MLDEDRRSKEKTYAADNYQRRLRMIAAIKLMAGCADCGYDKHPSALDFDHMPGTVKVQAVAVLARGSLKRLFDEIAKCEVVCANCHRIRTAERDQWRRPWIYEEAA